MALSTPISIDPAAVVTPPPLSGSDSSGHADGARGAASVWAAVLEELTHDASVSRASFAAWLRGTQLLAVHDRELVVGAQHSFALEKLERTFRPAIERAVRQVVGPQATVRFTVARAAAPKPQAPPPLPLRTLAQVERNASAAPARVAPVGGPPLNLAWTFETFVVDRGGQFAHAAACSVAENPSFAYNPLVLFGPTGAGKSHLLHAIGHGARHARPTARVTLVNDDAQLKLAHTVSTAELEAALKITVSGELVLVDDLHTFIAVAAPEAQVALAARLAALLDADRQIVVTLPAPLRDLPQIDPALRAQLMRGLLAEMKPRMLAPDRPPPAPAATAPVVSFQRQRIFPDQVVEAVATYYAVPAAALAERRRDKETVVPRQVAMYLMREETSASLGEIGARLGGRDHSTVLHGCERIAAALPHDTRLRADVDAVRARLGRPPAVPVARSGSAAVAAAT